MGEILNMRNVLRRLEVIANICVILGAAIFVVSVSWLSLRYYSSSRTHHSSIEKGKKITLPGVDWSASPQTLLLVLSTECSYCTASTPFYRRLSNQVALTHNTRLIAIFPQPVNVSREYLAKYDIKIDILRNLSASLGVKGTPTLILIDRDGVVIKSWDGMVPPAVEGEILNTVT